CSNCDRKEHIDKDCWQKYGGKEGQGPRQKKKQERLNTARDPPDEDNYAFTSFETNLAT
ncbi:hypothetical protein SERLA73DRAFT_47284, partial [Serpula lacrymans var. lacrymans S7.3]